MILFFSGTGNSAFVARSLSVTLQDEYWNVFEKIRHNDTGEVYSMRPYIIVCPTYGWKMPRILENWLENMVFTGSQEMYFVLTCGNDIGNAGAYLKQFCDRKSLHYRGCAQVVMPENYIAMFPVPDQEEANIIVEKAIPEIEKLAYYVQADRSFPKRKCSLLDRMKSSVVNRLFYSLFVHAKKFEVKHTCIHCGKCVDVCPMNNIHLENGEPVWEDHCTHCMACICKCPKEAIEYGTISVGKPRYHCPK